MECRKTDHECASEKSYADRWGVRNYPDTPKHYYKEKGEMTYDDDA